LNEILLLLIGQGSRALLFGICKLYVGIFDHWPILRCLGLIKHQKQASQLLSLGNYIPHWITVVMIAKMVKAKHFYIST
jgi:hypothetical protein